jgi:hypothetical protein
MLFRIVAPHEHRAIVGHRIFWCTRQAVTTEAGLATSWSAFEGKILLAADCRTLNEAKNRCRAAAKEEHPAVY